LALKEVRTSHGVLWACNNCGGRAVGLELLRRTFTPESINPLWLHAIRSEGQSSCKCPSCRNPMIEVALSDQAGVRVDVCRICHFVWFDAHEVDTLVPRPLPPQTKEMPEKARQAIAMLKVQQLAQQAREPEVSSLPADSLWNAISEFFGI
jgi:Zn-finger nucleic acid-binding protein